MIRHFGVAATFLAVALAGCTDGFDGDATAVICTNFGPITIQLYDNEAPVTSQNFLDLAANGDFDDVPFHRIITNFMMQGGDVTNGDGTGGKTASGDKLPDETHPDRPHDKPGLLSMANRGGDPTTGSSQFFITFVPTPHLNGKHTVFGEVIDGMEVVERVEDEAASRTGAPEADVRMITVLPGTTDATACPDEQPLEPANVAIDTITPGTFRVTDTTDRILVWARNLDDARGSLTWDLTGTDGGALPDGWSATIEGPEAVSGGGTAHTVLELTVPEGTSGTFGLELRVGASSQAILVDVALGNGPVSAPGDRIQVEYAGSCTEDGRAFDDGAFPTTLASGETVPGFDFGLLGLFEGESATLVLPGALGYGDSGGPTGCPGGSLTFDVTVAEFLS